MKNISLIIIFAFISVTAFSQSKSDLKGPAYKNYKPWTQKTKPRLVFKSDSKNDLKSFEYKNYKAKKNDKKELVIVKFGNSKRSGLKGPSYKNYKPSK